LHDYVFALLTPADLRFGNRVTFSGRAAIVPGGELQLDQVGLPEEMAWTFFGPQVAERLGDEPAVENRTEAATAVLDEIMAVSWVVINRAPSTAPTAVLAFHPVRFAEPCVRIHPLICRWLNADFDGDQVAVYLPLGEAAQQEAAEKLTVAGHIRRDPALIRTLSPEKDFIWGLGSLALTEAGRTQIKVQTGINLPSPAETNTQVALEDAIADWLAEKGLETAMDTVEKLRKLGEEIVRKSGASVSPFAGASLDWIPAPESKDPERWGEYVSQLAEQFATFSDYADPELGVHLTTMKTRQRPPQLRGLIWLFANRDPVTDVNGEPFIVRNSHVSGLTPDELNACVVGAREGLARFSQQWDQLMQVAPAGSDHTQFSVLARARRSQYPGIVFARAAAIGERDPLADVDSRLFVGLSAK
jgi:DNA-directed RNA polymerase beta' subunit